MKLKIYINSNRIKSGAITHDIYYITDKVPNFLVGKIIINQQTNRALIEELKKTDIEIEEET